MKTVALVPFKRFTLAKRRLRARYSDPVVEKIGRAMLEDVLAALAESPSLAEVQVLTDDLAVATVARASGARVVLRTPDPGLNPVLELAGAEASRAGFDATLVVLGDVPLLQPADVERVVELGRSHRVLIVPSSDGGTTLLYRRPPGCMPARFGLASAKAHEQGARECGIEPLVLDDLDARVRIDLDTPEDAQRLLDSPVRCRTRGILEKLRE